MYNPNGQFAYQSHRASSQRCESAPLSTEQFARISTLETARRKPRKLSDQNQLRSIEPLWQSRLRSTVFDFDVCEDPQAFIDTRPAPLGETIALDTSDSWSDASVLEFHTEPMALEAKTFDQRMNDALDTIEQHYERISKICRCLWGSQEFSPYMSKLIMDGNDGMGRMRSGFNSASLQAMLELVSLHDDKFAV